MLRAYSLLDIKSIDVQSRIIEGIASTPEVDRMGDVVESSGAQFQLPIPLLWQHDSRQPIGEVFAAKVTAEGITIRAKLAQIEEPGKLKDRLDEAWQSITNKLVRGLSIGFQSIESANIDGTYGVRFLKWLWLELSAVTIPANGDATITAIKAIDATHRAATGSRQVTLTGASVSAQKVIPMKTIQERMAAFAAEKTAKVARMNEIMGTDDGTTLDAAKQTEFDALRDDIKSIDEHLSRLSTLDAQNKAAAVPVVGTTVQDGSASRVSQIRVTEVLPKGIEFARAVMCKIHARLDNLNPVEVAKGRYPDNPRVIAYQQRGAVPAATTGDAVWLGNTVVADTLASEFIEFLRPQTIIGKFGTGGIPSLRRVPFNVRILGQTSGGEGYWVGQGAPKPLTSFQVAPTTLYWAKVANIAVLSEEIMRFSSPSAEALVRDELARAIIERLDTDFVDPAKAAVSNVSPASITNGLVPISTAGATADNVRTDIQNLLETFILNNINVGSLVLIMPNTLAMVLSLLRNSLGQREFDGITINGGTLEGIPVIASQYAANQSGSGNLVVAANASEIYLSDDGQVTVDMSRETSLQMLDNPTNNSNTATATSMVSMFQTNSVALRAERYINWAKRRAAAVAYLDDVNWGSIGSPS